MTEKSKRVTQEGEKCRVTTVVVEGPAFMGNLKVVSLTKRCSAAATYSMYFYLSAPSAQEKRHTHDMMCMYLRA